MNNLKFYNKHKKEYRDAYNSGCDFERELIVIELLKLAKKFSTGIMSEYKDLLNLIKKDSKKREARSKELLKEHAITKQDYDFEVRFNKIFLRVLENYIRRLKNL